MRFVGVRTDFPVSNSVVYAGYVFQTELTGIPPGETQAVPGGAGAELREIFAQLDRVLKEVGLDKTHVVSAKLYLQDLQRDLPEVEEVCDKYFGSHRPSRGIYGVDLRPGLLVEAAFVANVPVYE